MTEKNESDKGTNNILYEVINKMRCRAPPPGDVTDKTKQNKT